MTPEEVEEVQAAVVATINTLGETLIGPRFVPITSSPIPNEEVAKILTDARSCVPAEQTPSADYRR